VLLKQSTHALLLRLPADSVQSRRSPTYQSLTPKVVVNKVVKYWDGKRHVPVTNPVLNNTGRVTHEVVFAIICCMVYQRQPLYLWLVGQFQSGVTAEAQRKRKAPDGDVAARTETPRRGRRLRTTNAVARTGGAPGPAAYSTHPSPPPHPSSHGRNQTRTSNYYNR